MEHINKIDWLKQRLQQPLPGIKAQELMAGRVLAMPPEIPQTARPSAVLCLLYPLQGELNILLMKRMADKGAHSAQISFPGGKKELTDHDLLTTALRETREEVGVLSAEVTVLGGLTPLYIPISNFIVHPFVGYSNERPTFRINPEEVDHIIELPLNYLLHAERKGLIDVVSPAVSEVIRKVHAYRLNNGTVIWGATAMIISELEVLLGEFNPSAATQ